MTSKKILIVCCTKGDGKKTKLLESLHGMEDDVTVNMITNNTQGLSQVYNKYLISDNLIKHDIVLFVHDDVYIDDMRLKGKLYTAIESMKYDIVGLAGCTEARISKPALWHKMSTPNTWSGSVAHPTKDAIQTTSFGPWPKRCLLVDGLFMAVNLRVALDREWKFNENFSFHHYDLASCIDANKLKMKIGTFPIYVTHDSPGLLDINDKAFTESQDRFIQLYSNK